MDCAVKCKNGPDKFGIRQVNDEWNQMKQTNKQCPTVNGILKLIYLFYFFLATEICIRVWNEY